MPNWNELFLQEKHIEIFPEPEVYRFFHILQKKFPYETLNIWDLGCGGGRHTILASSLGYNIFASDNAPNSIELTKINLNTNKLHANVILSDMTQCPWNNKFHGIVSWDVIHHNILKNIERTIQACYDSLVQGGLFLLTLKSVKADLYGQGEEIEPNTFVLNKGAEKGVPHHYFDESGIRSLFHRQNWNILILAEQVITHYQKGNHFWEYSPFKSTTWGILLCKDCI